ncbi:Starch-binding associating with outer membrane [Filimonas lacunae]|uniref:Starch-binding associating with outer membrane n=1 Tax=Filimonas lacunae TaxID=477680 RepID=A0A173MKP9_9BACT|nr:RagB/SusD family nutrient uptake outer membrane protein [Filimonas lacunae]BAV08213.1 RagB/SusD domain protein [Filimonas lacunae]SIT33053.1 Starch-binding associating with outer membrane [Filimonas lacunae]
MKNKNILYSLLAAVITWGAAGCSKVLDKSPVTSVVRPDSTINITATDAESLISGMYLYYKGYDIMEFSILDRMTNGDAVADNCYAGGDNTANITLDEFTANSLNANLNRDWQYAYKMIGRTNIILPQIESCTDAALTAVRKSQMLSEARFFRAFCYFDLVRLFGDVPLLLKAPDVSSSESLLNSTIVARSSIDTVYTAILNDLWFAKAGATETNSAATRYLITKGAVNALLAKVYASMPTPNWDSVAYYCNQVIPQYSLVSDYAFLWDNNHKNNSEAIWEVNYFGYGGADNIGNWIPSNLIGGQIGKYEGGSWKKFNIPTNDLVNLFNTENDAVRLNSSIAFLNITGSFSDPNWPTTAYPFIVKYNDPSTGLNDFYIMRLPDIMLLKAEALVKNNDITGAMALVNAVRERVHLGEKSATTAADAETIIANERRMELAFEGHRWFDLVRTGKAIQVMSAQQGGIVNGVQNQLHYNVQPYRLLMPVPQNQIDLNPALIQTPGY